MEIKGKIDKNIAKQMRHALEAELDKLSREVGFNLKLGNCRYDASTATFQLECSSADVDVDRVQFEELARYMMLKPEDYRKEFTANGRRFQLVALKPNSPKYSVVGEEVGSGGQRYKFTDNVLKQIRDTEEVAH